jgi:hypothetical protein
MIGAEDMAQVIQALTWQVWGSKFKSQYCQKPNT